MRFVLSLAAVLFAASTSFGFTTIDDEFNRLKDSGENFAIVGQVCELVAQAEYEITYPAPQYEVTNGIAYGNGKRTIGELDVVVFDTKTKDVVSIGEVKCWKDSKGAIGKAMEQRKRFLKAVSKQGGLEFKSTHDKRSYAQSQFRKVKEFKSVGPLGTKAEGFDVEMEYTLEDLMGLRQKLMDCQAAGECKRP